MKTTGRRVPCVLVVLAWFSLLPDADSQEFKLQMEDGTLSRPIELREGAEVVLGTNRAFITHVKTTRDQTLDAMQGILIPSVDFRSADIRDVVAFLQKASVDGDRNHRGVRFRLDLCEEGGVDESAAAGAVTRGKGEDIPTVTFAARWVSLYSALQIVARVTRLRYRIQGDTVILAPLDVPDGEILRRIYPVQTFFLERVADLQEAGSGRKQEGEEGLKQFFSDFGVVWPRGTSLRYESALGALVVANTSENLQVLERVLWDLKVRTCQVEMEVSFVAFDFSRLSESVAKGVDGKGLMELWRQGHGELLAAPRLLTKSGVEASLRGATECIYPTEFSVCATATNPHAAVVASGVEPCGFETRETGAILTALPELSVDGNQIDVTISAQLVEDPVWQELVHSFTEEGHTNQTRISQPYFHVYSACTSVSVADGERVLISGGMPSRDGKRVVYAFLMARRTGIRGELMQTRNSGTAD